jgi:hypothetical protein
MNREIVGGGGATIYPLQGDVASTAGSSTVQVQGIQGIPVDASFPVGGEVITYDATDGTFVLAAPTNPLTLETNGTPNSTQTLLNLAAGTDITMTESGGTVTVNSTASGPTLETNGTANSSQSLLNLTGAGGVSITEAAGTVTIDGSGAGGFTTRTSYNITGRNFATTYTNTSGGTMFISVSAFLDGGTGGDYLIQGFCGGLNVQSATGTSTISPHSYMGISFMVLNGETYEVIVTDVSGAGVYGVGTWIEMTQ